MLKTKVKNIALSNHRKVDVEIYSRGGTDSPSLIIMIAEGKRYIPYQQAKLGWEIAFSGWLKIWLPDELLKEEFKKRDWFLKSLPKDSAWVGGVFTIPFAQDSQQLNPFQPQA